jgi:hypothetical protein
MQDSRLAAVAILLTSLACAPSPPGPASPYASLCFGLATRGPLPLDTVPARSGNWLLSIPHGWTDHTYDSLTVRESWSSSGQPDPAGRLDFYAAEPPSLPPGWPSPGDVDCPLPGIGDGVTYRHYMLPGESPVFVARVDWPGGGTVITSTTDEPQAVLLAVAAIFSHPRD